MKDIEQSPAATAVRLNTCERAIEVLTDVTTQLGKTQQELSRTTALIQQSLEYQKKEWDSFGRDVAMLKSDRAFVLGSWKTICVVAGIVVFLSPISNALVNWALAKHESTVNRANNGGNWTQPQQP